MSPRTTHAVLAAAIATGTVAAQAQPTATIDQRASVLYTEYLGGFAVAGDSGSDGSMTPVTTLSPTALDIAGRHRYDGSYLGWSVWYETGWNLWQDWRVGSDSISGSGGVQLDVAGQVVGPNCAPCHPTMQNHARNQQTIGFTLDEATDFSFHSENSAGQWTDLQFFDEASGFWFSLWVGPWVTQDTVFDTGGTLDPGRYRLRNNMDRHRSNVLAPVVDNHWSYTLTLHGAQVALVPEPPAALLALGGLAALLARRRFTTIH